MPKFQNHIEVLEAIAELRAKLPAQKDSYLGQLEVVRVLSIMYACLDINELRTILKDFKSMDRRAERRLGSKKKVA